MDKRQINIRRFETQSDNSYNEIETAPFFESKSRINICHPKVIMSYCTKIEMSYFKHAIILPEGGYYGRKGHDSNEYKGVKKGASNT
jgi:hypothetical protein